MRRLIGARTTLVISHNLVTVRDADRIAVLEHGRVIELGSHEQLIAAGRTYTRLFDLHHPAEAAAPAPALRAVSS